MTTSQSFSSSTEVRCPWAVAFGPTLRTRCIRQEGHAGMHEGPGLERFAYQHISWLPGDRRQFQSSRTDEVAWETT